ncbi:MAG: DoxX family membrane protein [Chloroflexi bacterium]|nr:DoxX family membrane protein [Chloroflexota bacterium]
MKTEPRQVPLFWISLLRLMLGVLFLTTWYSNLQKGFYTADGLLNFFTNVFPQANNPLTWYAAFINNVILPIRGFFSVFQLLTELLMGLALLAGAFTPLVSLVAAVFILNTFLATYGVDWPWSYLTILGILGVCFFTRAGRSLGADALLLKRFGERRLPLW